MPIDDKLMLSAVEALENAKKNLEAIATANGNFEEKAEEISKSIEDVFDRQKDIDKAILKFDAALDKLSASLERLAELQSKVEKLTELIQSLKLDDLEQIASSLQEKVSASIEQYEESLIHPKAKKGGLPTKKASSSKKKTK